MKLNKPLSMFILLSTVLSASSFAQANSAIYAIDDLSPEQVKTLKQLEPIGQDKAVNVIHESQQLSVLSSEQRQKLKSQTSQSATKRVFLAGSDAYSLDDLSSEQINQLKQLEPVGQNKQHDVISEAARGALLTQAQKERLSHIKSSSASGNASHPFVQKEGGKD